MNVKLLIIIALLSFALPVLAQAPAAQPTLAPEVQGLVNQMHQVGCNAEETAAAQTIVQLQKQVADLQKRLKDPPKSGATKH